MTNHSRTLYVGMTNDLKRRVQQHKLGTIEGFTSRYRVSQLVHYETFPSALQAIAREKQIKGWTRAKKIDLIEQQNPRWEDIAANWFSAVREP